MSNGIDVRPSPQPSIKRSLKDVLNYSNLEPSALHYSDLVSYSLSLASTRGESDSFAGLNP